MTQKIEQSNIMVEQVAAVGSRYRTNQNVIYYGDQRFVTYDLYIRTNYEKTNDEQVMVITKGVEYRPDLVSYDFYGFVDNWWRILEANKMQDVFEFKAGKTILLPEMGR
tara:strand:- start:824 stop:1150 length:327 start_codon:yes stop_codon:yes gene_type:complete